MSNKLLMCLTIFLMIFIGLSAQANRNITVQDFSFTKKLTTSSQGSHWTRNIREKLVSQGTPQPLGFGSGSMTPTGSLSIPMSPKCHPSYIKKVLAKSTSPAEQSEAIDSYFHRCGERLKDENKQGLWATLALDGITYNIFENKLVRPYQMTLSTGDSIEGFIGLKNDGRPHPLVIVRCGLFCDGTPSGSTKMMLMHLFEEGPFHIMVVQSHSSNPNIIANNRVSIGGIYEAQETMAIGQWARENSEFSDQISSLHMLGISLGGSDAYFTSLYNSLNLDQSGGQVYNSVMAFCPVTDLRESMIDLFTKAGIVSSTLTKLTKENLLAAHPHVDDLLALVDSNRLPNASLLPDSLGELSRTFLNRQNPENFLHPFTGTSFSTMSEFWEKSNFLNSYDLVTTPTLALGSNDDPVVFLKSNSLRLKKRVKKDSSIQVATGKYGGHCAFSVSYGWPVTSAILQGYFLSYSPEFTRNRTTHSQRIDFPNINLAANETHVDQKWIAKPGSSEVSVTFKVFRKAGFNCSKQKPFTKNKNCFKKKISRLNISNLNFVNEPPQTSSDADRLTRWLNTNITILGANGPILGTQSRAIKVEWR